MVATQVLAVQSLGEKKQVMVVWRNVNDELAVHSQDEIKQMIVDSQKYMAKKSFWFDYFVARYKGDDITKWGEGNYTTNWSDCHEAERRIPKNVSLVSPIWGSIIWNLKSGELQNNVKNSSNSYAPFIYGVNAVFQNMTLPQRLDSGQYTINVTNSNGQEFYQITVTYPPIGQILDKVPFAHICQSKMTENYFKYHGKDSNLLTSSAWFFSHSFVESNLEELDKDYIYVISLFMSKDQNNPVIYRLLEMNSNGVALNGRDFVATNGRKADRIMFPAVYRMNILNKSKKR